MKTTSEPTTPPLEAERFAWLERPDDDFPYYRGRPAEISPGGWWIVMLAVAVGFAILIHPPPFLRGFGGFLATILYFALPLAALAYVAGNAWTAIFRPLRGRDFLLMIGFAILNIVVALIVGSIMINLMETTANEAAAGAGALEGGEVWLFFARTGLQLFGEEVMSILPFLAILTWLVAGRGMGRKTAIIVATLAVAVIFAAAHLPTYGWNVAQALMGVGVARIVLLLPYIMTKNIWVSTGAHILNDWMMFGVSILSAGGVAGDGA